MTSPPIPDPYKVLGVAKDAALADIRSAHRKLVLKCHPDKVQDAALKAIKQDEFQRVQQAYELLSDDTRREQYDDQQKLFDLRREMGRSGSGSISGKSVFKEYEVRSAEPRTTTFRTKPKESTKVYAQPTKVYAQPSPRSYEDNLGSRSYEEPMKARARKTASYEERKRPSTREEEKRKKTEDERENDRSEKEMKKSAHSTAKKNRDKERRKGSEDKYSRTAFVVDADDSDELPYRPRMEKKSSHRSDDELRAREELARAAEKLRKEDLLLQTERTRKLDAAKDFAAQYMQAARRKADPEPEFRPKPLRRAETFQESTFNARYAPQPQPYVEDEDYPRRSSARRASDQVPSRSRDRPRSSEKDGKRSPSYEPVIVDATPSAPHIRAPSLQTHSSAPPMTPPRKEPHRSKTMDFSRNSAPVPPPLPRASTFQSGDRAKPVSRGSKLKNHVEYNSGSDSDAPYKTPRAVSPPPRRRNLSPIRYVIEKGRSIPLNNRHRSELREDDYDRHRDRSESPRGSNRRSAERPPMTRSGGSGTHQSFTRPYYGGSTSPEPIIQEARPRMPPRESSSRSNSSRGPFFGEVKYAPNYGPEHVSYTPVDPYRRGSDPTHHRDYAYPPRPSAYA